LLLGILILGMRVIDMKNKKRYYEILEKKKMEKTNILNKAIE
jgi:hypothetical protein